MLDLAAVVTQVRRGMIPAHVYGDPEVFALERDRLFARSWVFLAHESEIPDPGDYVVRRVLADSFIVARDESGVVRVMFNMCLHRGMQVCRAEMGNASHFRCPYHAWTYRNDGRLYQGFGEYGQRHWLGQWSDFLEREPDTQFVRDMGGAR